MTYLDTFLVPVLLITLINTPKLNKTVSQIRGTQDGRFHLHQLGRREGQEPLNKNLPSCVQVALWHMILQPWSLQMSPRLVNGDENGNLCNCLYVCTFSPFL